MTQENNRRRSGVVIAAGMAVISLCGAALIAFYPPPATFAKLMPADNPWVRDGRFAVPVCNGVQCKLCPYECFLPEGARGICKVRINYGGRIKTLVYSKSVSVHLDPIEKKPVYHLYPGSLIYSLASPGCNLRCKGCQNWEISQIYPEQAAKTTLVPERLDIKVEPATGRVYGELKQKEVLTLSPEDVVSYALATRSRSIAYTLFRTRGLLRVYVRYGPPGQGKRP